MRPPNHTLPYIELSESSSFYVLHTPPQSPYRDTFPTSVHSHPFPCYPSDRRFENRIGCALSLAVHG